MFDYHLKNFVRGIGLPDSSCALENIFSAEAYINPVPHALMLTAIVVSLGTTGVGLALLMKIKDIYGTIEEDEITGKGGK